MQPFFPVALTLAGRRCVVVGAPEDAEAIEKAASLREAGADVACVDPENFAESNVDSAFLVISTPKDAALSSRLHEYAQRHGFLLCCIDQPEYGSFAMTATAKAGPVRVAISTSGQAPAIAKRLREDVQEAMDAVFVRFVETIARRRAEQHGREANVRATQGFEARLTFTYPPWFGDEPRG